MYPGEIVRPGPDSRVPVFPNARPLPREARIPSREVQIPTVHSGVPAKEHDVTAFKPTDPAAQVYERAKPAVVRLEMFYKGADGKETSSRGSGFFISESGKLATAYHVIARRPDRIEVQMADGKKLNATISDVKPMSDVATLDVQGALGQRFPALELAPTSRGLSADEPVYVLGHPHGWEKTYLAPGSFERRISVADTNVSDLPGQNPNRMLLETTAQAIGGNSGGPMLDKNGRVIGIVNFGSERSGIAATVDDLHSLLGNAKPREYFPTHPSLGTSAIVTGLATTAGAAQSFVLSRPHPVALGRFGGAVGGLSVVLAAADLNKHDYEAFKNSWYTGTTAEKVSATTNMVGDLSMIVGGLGTILGPRVRLASTVLLTAGSGAKFLNHLFTDRTY